MQTPVYVCSLLDLDDRDAGLIAQVIEGAEVQIMKGRRPVRVRHVGMDIANSVAWITLTFVGSGAGLFFTSFLSSLGSELGKHVFERLIGKAEAKEKEIEVERGMPARSSSGRMIGIPDDLLSICFEHDSGIKFLIGVPSHDPIQVQETLKPLPELIDSWVAEAAPLPEEINVVTVGFSEGIWSFRVVRRGGLEDTTYEFYLDEGRSLL